MHLTSLIHRKRLFDLATRWFADCPHEEDGRFLTKAFIYENVITAPLVREMLVGIQRTVHPEPLRLLRVRSKDELRNIVLHTCVDPSPREADLFQAFQQRPEEFFPGTPTDVMLGLRGDGSILAMARVKRLRRIAEKCSRRVADRLAGAIQDRARALAGRRAAERGIRLLDLHSTDMEMKEDFAQAERVVSRSFRDGTVVFEPRDLRVDDGIGVKFIGRSEEMMHIEEAIRNLPNLVGVEREEHRGKYNDVNLLVDLELPAPETIIDRERGRDWSYAEPRGLSASALAEHFPDYVASGARSFRAEVILQSRADFVESEFGDSLHEARILEQRHGAGYAGRIASNASFLIEYMLMLSLSPTTELHELPVKMWGRYLPDVYALAVWNLFGINLGQGLFEALAPWGDGGT
jgi:hypothetical protein